MPPSPAAIGARIAPRPIRRRPRSAATAEEKKVLGRRVVVLWFSVVARRPRAVEAATSRPPSSASCPRPRGVVGRSPRLGCGVCGARPLPYAATRRSGQGVGARSIAGLAVARTLAAPWRPLPPPPPSKAKPAPRLLFVMLPPSLQLNPHRSAPAPLSSVALSTRVRCEPPRLILYICL